MTLFLGLCRQQCGVLAVVGLAGWILVVLLALMGELAWGAHPSDVLAPGSVAVLAAALLPEVLQVVLPVSLAHGLLSMEEGGELRALRAVGVRPWFVAVALCAPFVPILIAMHPLVHEVRPAAFVLAKQAKLGPESAMSSGLIGQGVGLVQDEHGWRALLPVGDSALAITATRVGGRPGVLALGPGKVQVVAANNRVQASRFDAVNLTIAPWRMGLPEYTEKDFSSHFLETGSMRWRRAQLDWGSRRSGELIARELARRGLMLPSVVASLLICLGLLFVQRPLVIGWVHGVVTPLAVTMSLFLPRWLS